MSHTWAAKLEHKKALSAEDARFIFEQSEKFLIDVNESHKSIVERTYTLLAVFGTILTALIGFNVERLSTSKAWTEPLSLTLWITIVYIILGTIYLSKNIRPTNYMGVGSPPMNLFNDCIFAINVPGDKRAIRIIMSEIERYQFRIEVNKTINQEKWKVFTVSLYGILSIPVVFLLVYLIVTAVQ